VVAATVDGKTVAFAGDNYFLATVEIAGQVEERPIQTTVFRNSFQLEMHRRCVEVMRAIAPDLVCPGHGNVLPCDPRSLDRYADYVALKERAFRGAVAEPADHYIDLFWARLRPYVTTVAREATAGYTHKLRNNLERPATYGARLIPPPGWTSTSDVETLELAAGQSGEIQLVVTAPADESDVRALVTAEVFIDGRSQGPIAEALATVT
jgi:hypothetical protein